MGKTIFFSLAASLLVCIAPNCHSQPVTFTSKSVMTLGGITYLRTTATVESCYHIYGLPVTRNQNSLRLEVFQSPDPNCIPLDGYTQAITNTFVLGALESGDYSLQIVDSFYPQIRNWSSFSVTNNHVQTISVHARTNLSDISFDIAGVSDIKYIIQTSTNFVDWSNIRTNIGAPFTFTAPLQSSDLNRYYRARIISQSEYPVAP